MDNVELIDRDRPRNANAAAAAGPRLIADKLFVSQLSYIREVIDFLVRSQVDLSKQTEDLKALASLGTVKYSRSGESASQEDWKNLYQISHSFVSQVTADKATSFAVWQTRGFYGLLPLAFFIGALIALAICYFDPRLLQHTPEQDKITLYYSDFSYWERIGQFVAVLLWTCSLGGLGVSAFFGTSLLTQLTSENATNMAKWKERITDKNYLRTRLALGILFAFVIGLPFGFKSLYIAWKSLITPTLLDDQMFSIILAILAPFLFGFSTTVVLAVLERVIEGIRTILGVQGNR